MKLLSYGPAAVLAEFDCLADAVNAATAWRAARLPGVVDIVPAARTVLVVHDGALDQSLLRRPLPAADSLPVGELVTVDVSYDGEDLAPVASALGLTAAQVVEIHSGTEYVVAFCGFMPGFSYLSGLDSRLILPRRATPRPRVAAGSVAIASEFTAIYPGDSPGGWHLLGSTRAVMWQADREPPALLPPGTRVRFRPQ